MPARADAVRSEIAVSAERRAAIRWADLRVIPDACRESCGGSRRAASVVGHQIGGAAHQIRAGPLEDVSAAVAESDGRQSAPHRCRALGGEGARGRHRGVQPFQQVRCRVGVDVGQVRQCAVSSAHRGIWGSGRRGSRCRCSSESPNRSPRPVSASAVAVSVWFSLIGSTFSAIAVTRLEQRVELGGHRWSHRSPIARNMLLRQECSGELKDTYLLPNTVVAGSRPLRWPESAAGSAERHPGLAGADGWSARSVASTSEMLATRPISTPL